MANAKVILNETTLMDVTGTTVDADHLLEGTTAIGPDGELVVGTASLDGGQLPDFLNNAWPSGDVVITGATKIRGGAFAKNTAITSVSSNSVTSIGETGGSDHLLNVGAFYGCTSLTSVSFPNLTYLGFRAFQNCSNLTSVNLPALTTMGIAGSRDNYAFGGCSRLQLLHLPELTYVNGNYSMGSVGSTSTPVTIVLPKLAGVAPHFRSSKCAAVDLGPGVTSLPTYGIYGTTMPVLILRRTEGVVTASAANAISDITTTSKVYVPSALIDSYKEATNWSTKGDVFYPIEGSIYENAYADGTPIT